MENLTEEPKRCCMKCEMLACFSYNQNNYCLIHMNTNLDYIRNKVQEPLLLSNSEMEKQREDMENLWKEAISNLVVRMLEYQQGEVDINNGSRSSNGT